MTALPTRKLEAYRYADIDALASVWTELAPASRVEIAAQQKLQQIWLPSGDDIDIRRVEMVVEAGAVVCIFALNNASRYGRIELDVTMHEGADFALHGANIGGGNSTLEIVTTLKHVAPGATSRQTIRSVLGGKATGSFLGRIEVAREGQQTDAEQSVKAHDPDGWALLLDANGNLAEGMGCNVFVVREAKLYTPSERYVLPGVSRQMTFDLARKLGLPVIEGDIDLFDAANADEMFLTSTSLCIGAVRSFNGAKVGDGRAPGAVTKRLIDAYIDEVGCDFVKQYLDRLS